MPEAPDSRRSAVHHWSRPTTPKQPRTGRRHHACTRASCSSELWTPRSDGLQDRPGNLAALAIIVALVALAAYNLGPRVVAWLIGGTP